MEAGPPAGTPFLLTLPPNVLPSAVGANGFVLPGTFFDGGGLHWMPTSGVTPIGGRAAVAISRDGKTIVGNALDGRGVENAAIWQGGTSWRLLGSLAPAAQPCDLLLSSTHGASDDARVIVGLAWDGCAIARAYRWEEATGMVDLGSLSGESTRANSVSGDGRVVVGWEEAPSGFRQGAKWVDGKEELIQGPSGMVGEAFGANADGSLVTGMTCDPTDTRGPPAAWAWTAKYGLRCYPVVPPSWAPRVHYSAYMGDTSDDGRVIGGAIAFGLDSEAVVWFDGEAVFLRDYLRANGIPDAFEGWVNTGAVSGVSSDGRILVGSGAGPATFQGYMVVLPELGAK